MRVLVLSNLYPNPHHPLRAPFNRQQLEALAQTHEVRVISPIAWMEALGNVVRGRRGPTAYVSTAGIRVDHPLYCYPPKVLQHVYGECYLKSIAPLFNNVARNFRPDVVLSCWAHPDGWAAVRLARQAGMPVVVKVHGSDVLIATRNGKRRHKIAEALINADGVVAVGQHLADAVVSLGVDSRRVCVVHHGVNCEVFKLGSQRQARRNLGLTSSGPLLLYVGNLLQSKGVIALMSACRLLKDKGIQFNCTLIGEGRHKGEVARAIEQWQLHDQVALAGQRSQSELAEWYQACDMVVLPSYSEGIPNVLREGLACGRPFVATNVGGIPEIAHSSYSRLVPPGDPEQLAVAIAEMLEKRPSVDTGLTDQVNPTWAQSADRLADCLHTAMDTHRTKPQLAFS